MKHIEPEFIHGLQNRLANHPIYGALETLDDLRVFMSHHVHSVWDFMSLIKFLQHHVAPVSWPWVPGPDAEVQRFINELVLEEETDQNVPGAAKAFSSHFMLYVAAMREVGADADRMLHFVDKVAADGIQPALASGLAPAPACDFNRTTFGFIESGKAHCVAAALALGREHLIPAMFRAFLARMTITQAEAPILTQTIRINFYPNSANIFEPRDDDYRGRGADLPFLPQSSHPSGRGFPRPPFLASAGSIVW